MAIVVEDLKRMPFLVSSRDGTILKVVFPHPIQMGMDGQADDAMLAIKQGLSFSSRPTATVSPVNIRARESIILIAPDSRYDGSVTFNVVLPIAKEVGQLHIVKDVGGSAATSAPVITAAGGVDVDGSSSFTFSQDNQSAGFIWTGSEWVRIFQVLTAGAGAGSAPDAATYVTLTANGTLTNERTLAVSSDLTLTDGGAGSTVTVGLDDTTVVAGSYTNTSITVDAKGRITSISTGAGGSGGGADPGATYVLIGNTASLANERALTAGDGILITDNGAGSSVVISSRITGDAGAQYLVLANTASLSQERAFAAGTGLLGTDGGANSSYTLGINNNTVATISGSTFSGLVKFNAGASGTLTAVGVSENAIVYGNTLGVLTGYHEGLNWNNTYKLLGVGYAPGFPLTSSQYGQRSGLLISGSVGFQFTRDNEKNSLYAITNFAIGGMFEYERVFNYSMAARLWVGRPFGGGQSQNAWKTMVYDDPTSYPNQNTHTTFNVINYDNATVAGIRDEAVVYIGAGSGSSGATGNTRPSLYTVNDALLAVSRGFVGIGTASPQDKLAVVGSTSFTGSVAPGVTNTYDFGTASKLWRTVYATSLSGSLTKLGNGSSFLVAGDNITITSASNGQVFISSVGASGSNVAPGAVVFGSAAGTLTGSHERFHWNSTYNLLNVGTSFTAPLTQSFPNVNQRAGVTVSGSVGLVADANGEKNSLYAYSSAGSGRIIGLFEFERYNNHGAISRLWIARPAGGGETQNAWKCIVADDPQGYPYQNTHTSFNYINNVDATSVNTSAVVYIGAGSGSAGVTGNTRPSLWAVNDAWFATVRGNVGIGTTTPQDKLSVVGSTSFTGSVAPGVSNTYDFGTASKLWRNVFATSLSGSLTTLGDGSSYLVAGSNVTITSASNGQIFISSTGGSGGGGGDPGPSYLVLAATASLPNERVFTVGTGLLATDAGAGNAYTLGINDNVVATITGSTFTGQTTFVTASSPVFMTTRVTTSASFARSYAPGESGRFTATADIDSGNFRTVSVTAGNGTTLFDIWLNVNESGFSVARKYTVASLYGGSPVVNKIVDTGPYTIYDLNVTFTKPQPHIVLCTISHNYPGTRNVGITFDWGAVSTGGGSTVVTIL